ncbi:MAG TPA: S8 family serine peptidase, partial [Euzebya sp.]|nr:S8 family serine peptidase [Euzebya sp.]
AAQDEEVSRDQLRAEMVAAYTQATGTDPDAGYLDLGTSRTSALAQQYYDECDDGSNLPDGGVQASRAQLYRGGANSTGGVSYNPAPAAPSPFIDLRSMFVLQSTDDNGRFDQTGFLLYMCQEWGFNTLGAGGITFGLYTTFEETETEYPTVLGDEESGPDFIVSIFPEPNVPERPYQIMAIRTPSRDRSTWTVTFLDEANRLDLFEIDGVVPTSAIGDFTADSGFAWTVEVVDTQQPDGGRDWFPERNYLTRVGSGEDAQVGTNIPQFPVPDDCGLQREGQAQTTYRLLPQAVTPNDDGFAFQWYHNALDTPEAWDTIRDSSAGGRPRPVTIAVVDTGIDSTRFDFLDGGARVVAGLDAVYGLELEGGDNGGAIGPIIGPNAVGYEDFGASPPPRNSDRDPHGTGVASLIGAAGNNLFGIAGVDWGARLMPIRVNDVNGCISNVVVAEGIKWAVDHGADIVHISLGAPETTLFTPDSAEADTPECADGIDNDRDGTTDFQPGDGAQPDFGCDSAEDGSEGLTNNPGLDSTPACSDGRDNDGDGLIDLDDADCTSADDNFEGNDGESRDFDPLRETIDYALEQGVPVVAAAGNFATEGDPIIYPSAYPGVISVGASDRAGNPAFYSSTGRWLDILAPGGNNAGTLAQDIGVLWELDRIRSVAGTSFAAPLVTGAASLYMGLNPHITRGFTPSATPPDPAANFPDEGYQRTVDDVRIAIQNASLDIAPAGHDVLSGWGRMNINRMLDVEAAGGPLADPARVQLPRTNADSVIEAAEGVALSRPEVLPPYVVFSRSDVAVDALAASPLLSEGPLLVANHAGVAASTMAVLDQLMPDGGPVYLLGGDAALSPAVDEQLRGAGYDPVRLAGDSRYETAIAVGEEVRRRWGTGTEVGILRADGGDNPSAQWADALSGGAYAAETRMPMLVTGTDALHPDVAEALSRWDTQSTIVFGGTAAISASVMADLPTPTRIAGDTRDETATAVAEQLWDDTDGYMIVNGYYARGWVHALAAAGWAADLNRPLLYTGATDIPPATVELLQSACPGPDGVHIVGGASLVTGTAESSLLEAVTC